MKVTEFSNKEKAIEPKTRLYRYLNQSGLEHFLNDGIGLTRMVSWPDRFEVADFEFLQQFPKSADDRKREGFFASCWTLDQLWNWELGPSNSLEKANTEIQRDGSAAMWENYCSEERFKSTGGVRIATTVEKLQAVFSRPESGDEKIVCGPVQYCAKDDWIRLNNKNCLEETFFYKRVGYRHESEYRFVTYLDNIAGNHFSIKLNDYFDFLDEILIFPLKNNKFEKEAGMFHKIGTDIGTPTTTGTNIKNGNRFCRVSQLYGIVSDVIGNVKYIGS